MDFLHWEGAWTALQPVVASMLFASLFFGAVFSAEIYPPAPMAVFMLLVPAYLYQVRVRWDYRCVRVKKIAVEAFHVSALDFIEVSPYSSTCVSCHRCCADATLDHLGVFN